jgi:hypothetical protein
MKDKVLCNWLIANSSGVYRPAAEAAHRIEDLNEALSFVRLSLANITQGKVHPEQEILTVEQILEVLKEYER